MKTRALANLPDATEHTVAEPDGPWLEVLGDNKWVFGRENPRFKISIQQLAKGLSQINRFNGNTSAPYSDAQHMVFVSELLDLDPRWAMAGLFHDAPELFLGDIASPVKRLIGGAALAPYKREDAHIYGRLLQHFGVAFTLDTAGELALKHADLVALKTEKRWLQSKKIKWGYYDEIPVHHSRVRPLSAKDAARAYVRRFNTLKRRIGPWI